MKKSVSPAIMVAVVVLMVLVLGFISYKTFGPRNPPGIENEEMRKKYMPNGYTYPPNPRANGAAGTSAPAQTDTQQFYRQQYEQHQRERSGKTQ